MRTHRWVAFALALALGVGIAPATPSAAAPAQLRALWVDAFGEGLNDPDQIDTLVAQARAMNLNAIFAQVVRRGDCFCERSLAPRTDEKIAARPFDPLQRLIERAHAHGIEVHAWIIATDVWRGSTPPSDPRHVFNLHGPSATGAADWMTRRSDGLDQVPGEGAKEWLIDPGHPDAQDWIVGLATSIVANYDVDGINLDRIRYPDGNVEANVPSWGYNPTALARFQAATGRADRPAPQDAQWTQWRRDQVTAIVRRVYLESYALKPRVRVSADVIAYGAGPQSQGGWTRTRTYAEVLQDWRGWLAEGIVDLAISMDYKRDAVTAASGDQRRMYAEWSEFAKDNQLRRQTAIGSALYLNTVDASLRQIREALAPSASGNVAAGWIGYSYRTPDAASDVGGTRSGAASRSELVRALTQAGGDAVFDATAAVPAMPWKTQPSSGHVRGTLVDAAGAALGDRAVTLLDASGSVVLVRSSDGRGAFGFVDVAPGRYTLRAASASAGVTVAAGGLVTVTLGKPDDGATFVVGPDEAPSDYGFGAGLIR